MQTEVQTNPSERYLLCNYSLSDKRINRVKVDIQANMANSQKDDLYYQFLNWKRKKNEIVVFTMYAFADIALPKQYDIVFELDNLNNCIEIVYTIKQAIINGWYPVNEIGHGHKHILVLEFDGSIPKIFDLVPGLGAINLFKKKSELGLCSRADFESIKKRLTKSARES